MNWITRYGFILIILNSILSTNTIAREIDITGYASLIGTYTDNKDVTYLNEYAENYLDFTHHSHIGLQFNSQVVDKLELSLTLLSEGKESYQTRAKWFYATYAINQNSSFRFGRLKTPFYLVSNYIDIGHAYPWVVPPEEVYSTNVINSPEGVEYIFETQVFDAIVSFNTYLGSDRNEIYLSSTFINDTGAGGANNGSTYKAGEKARIESHELFGFELSIATDHVTFQVTHNQGVVDSKTLNINESRISIGSFGLILDIGNFILYSELTHRDTDASIQSLLPDQNSSYVTFGYQISKFLPYITLARIDKGKTKSKYALVQESTMFGLRYDVNQKMDIKIQAAKIKPGFSDGNTGRYGLFDNVVADDKEPLVVSMSVDILF